MIPRPLRHGLSLLGITLTVAAMSACALSPKPPQKPAHDRNTLWRMVHESCVPAARRDAYPPAPCIEVSAPGADASGYAVLKDLAGRYQYLVLPLARIVGIESPVLQRQDTPDYLADAWAARLYVEAALHKTLPREAMSLVVNALHDRSQDQLHIHVDCIRPDVHDALRRLLPGITGHWQPLGEPLPPHGGRYQAKWTSGSTPSINAFKSLAASLPHGDRMALHSLAVVGARRASGEPGFILLSSRYEPAQGDRDNAEDLQDRACTIAVPDMPPVNRDHIHYSTRDR
jgi:CDP-diacylglycerol pyrophosphatase